MVNTALKRAGNMSTDSKKSIKNEDKSFNNYNDISQKDLSGCINREVKEALSTLNRALWDELCDYLIEIIGTEAYAVKELKEYGK